MINKLPNKIKKQLFNINKETFVACSGGGDSVALVYLLYEINFKIFKGIIYYNHNLRPKDEIQKEKSLVKKIANDLNLEFISDQWINPELSSGEEKARIKRYKFFRKTILKRNIYILLGHTLDDQIETFFLNLIRGTGLKGLCGIPEERGNFKRPMLNISRAELRNYLNNNKIKYINDSTNNSMKFKRNRIRKKLLPLLENISGRDIKKIIHRNIISLKEDEKIIEFFIDEFLYRVAWPDSNGYIVDLNELKKLPAFLIPRILRRAVKESGIPFVSAIQTERLINLTTLDSGKFLESGYLNCLIKKNKLYIRKNKNKKIPKWFGNI